MKISKITLIAFWSFCSLAACNQNVDDSKKADIVNSNETQDSCSDYPSDVVSLKLQDIYDSSRWYIYTRQCDLPYIPKDDSTIHKTFGELELRFDKLIRKGDTIELNFNFIDRGKPVLPTSSKDFTELVTGVGYNITTRKKIYMSSPSGVSVAEKGSSTRYENPLQPEVSAYIKNNWNKLNKCFRKLAE